MYAEKENAMTRAIQGFEAFMADLCYPDTKGGAGIVRNIRSILGQLNIAAQKEKLTEDVEDLDHPKYLIQELHFYIGLLPFFGLMPDGYREQLSLVEAAFSDVISGKLSSQTSNKRANLRLNSVEKFTMYISGRYFSSNKNIPSRENNSTIKYWFNFFNTFRHIIIPKF